MIKPKVLFLVLAGGSSEHLANLDSQAKTCFHATCGADVIWMMGDVALGKPKIRGRNLLLPLAETYENLLPKTIQAINWCLVNMEFDYLIRTNTSSYFNIDRTLSFLNTISDYPFYYGGYRGRIQLSASDGNEETIEYAGGAGIILNKNAVEILAKMDPTEYLGLVDDVAIGKYFSELNYELVECDRVNITDFEAFRYSFHYRIKAWHNSKITRARFFEIDDIFRAKDNRKRTNKQVVFALKQAVRAVRIRSFRKAFKQLRLVTHGLHVR